MSFVSLMGVVFEGLTYNLDLTHWSELCEASEVSCVVRVPVEHQK